MDPDQPALSPSRPSPGVTVVDASISSVSDHQNRLPKRRRTQQGTEPRARKAKVSRACDRCKLRKAKCSGTEPCDTCFRKGRQCQYLAEYLRGRPPTPPPLAMSATAALAATARQPHQSARPGRRNGSMSTLVPAPPLPRGTTHAAAREPPQQQETSGSASEGAPRRLEESRTSSSRASPVLGVAEIQGQVLDSTSGLTFLHRAWKRLSQPNRQHESRDDTGLVPQAANHSIEQQPIFAVGDRPLPSDNADDEDAAGGVDARLWFPDHARAHELLVLYFDVCIATYRLLHRPTVEGWLEAVEGNLARGRALHDGIGRAKTTVLLSALAIATTHHEKSRGFITVEDEARSLARSDRLFCEGTRLSSHEKGLLRLESAQARLVQVLYLLTTSRPNRAWYVFGEALQIVSALGLHRRASRKLPLAPGSQKPDYIQSQCLKRTFWTAYILDHYLGIILGRPRHFHDEDIDQELPDAINDEDMRADVSLSRADTNVDCHLDALIFHARCVPNWRHPPITQC